MITLFLYKHNLYTFDVSINSFVYLHASQQCVLLLLMAMRTCTICSVYVAYIYVSYSWLLSV